MLLGHEQAGGHITILKSTTGVFVKENIDGKKPSVGEDLAYTIVSRFKLGKQLHSTYIDRFGESIYYVRNSDHFTNPAIITPREFLHLSSYALESKEEEDNDEEGGGGGGGGEGRGGGRGRSSL